MCMNMQTVKIKLQSHQSFKPGTDLGKIPINVSMLVRYSPGLNSLKTHV